MKVVFFGTPEYVLPILKALHKNFEVVAVVTQPPRKVGRDQMLTFSPVDDFAHKRKIDIIFEPEKVPTADFGVCAAYGRIIPKQTIAKFKYGILNIHPSLLPKYRGASPVQAAISDGETTTGVTIIKMDEKMDHGPVVTQFKEEILHEDTTDSLRIRLFERSTQVLLDLIPNYIKGRINLKEQNHEDATFTKVLKKEDGYIEPDRLKTPEAERFIRAMYAWPCAWTKIEDGRRLKLLPEGKVQLEGKTPVTMKQFESAYPDALPS